MSIKLLRNLDTAVSILFVILLVIEIIWKLYTNTLFLYFMGTVVLINLVLTILARLKLKKIFKDEDAF